ncbi:MAG: hypothetical protein IJB00_03860 [Akkermansia sp.]|nr:hypothetical protein [Akkermansia sp.]
MISLISTLLYLAKDTVHRWFARISSPLARVLVVFFLSLCALFFLGTYVISVNVVRTRIMNEGGNMIHAVISPEHGSTLHIPGQRELKDWLQADSWNLLMVGSARREDGSAVTIYTTEFSRFGQILPLMAHNGSPTLLCPAEGRESRPEGLTEVSIGGRKGVTFTVSVRHLPANHPLSRTLKRGGLLLSPEEAAAWLGEDRLQTCSRQLLLRINNISSAADIRRAEQYLQNLIRLEGASAGVNSAVRLLEQLDIVLDNQMQCRAGFCLGIVLIVGILLTSLAGMEYRQNEYIYTLMKSFGIHPMLLVLSFLCENLFLVAAAFAAAFAVFMHSQAIILTQFFKLGEFRLSVAEIQPELQLICAALLLCVLVSSLPIVVAANREIGRVLK